MPEISAGHQQKFAQHFGKPIEANTSPARTAKGEGQQEEGLARDWFARLAKKKMRCRARWRKDWRVKSPLASLSPCWYCNSSISSDAARSKSSGYAGEPVEVKRPTESGAQPNS